MRYRLLLGPVMIALLVGALALDQTLEGAALPDVLRVGPFASVPPGTIILPVLLGLVMLAARELSAMLEAEGIEGSKRMLSFAAAVGLLAMCLVPEGLSGTTAVAVVAASCVVVLVLALAFYSRHRTVEGVIAAAGGVLLAFVYLGLMAGFILAIRREHDVWILGWLLLVVKACDIGAYFTGKAVGRTKLIVWLSPGKTWEGLLGGVVLSAVVAIVGLEVIERVSKVHVPAWWWGVLLGVVLGVTGQLGDLLESLVKRDAGKKDSGRSIPGFGGVLDVLDSPLLAAPVAFWCLRAFVSQGYFTSGGPPVP